MMKVKEYCRYIHAYSELEGLQRAHTLTYCASVLPQGVALELRLEQGGARCADTVVCPEMDFAQAMRLMRYLCENGVGLGQWLEVLDDLGQSYLLPEQAQNGCETQPICGFCRI